MNNRINRPRLESESPLRPVRDLFEQPLSVARIDRERLKGHKGKVIWLTGLSGSGKSTLANLLEGELNRSGRHTYLLDGDNLRLGLNSDLGFSIQDRAENIRRVAEVSRLMMDAGLIVITSFISPIRTERERARAIIGKDNFVEVYVNTPLTICEERDTKGLYRKARSGLLSNMTGINSPYEAPLSPSIIVDGSTPDSADQSIQRVIERLHLDNQY